METKNYYFIKISILLSPFNHTRLNLFSLPHFQIISLLPFLYFLSLILSSSFALLLRLALGLCSGFVQWVCVVVDGLCSGFMWWWVFAVVDWGFAVGLCSWGWCGGWPWVVNRGDLAVAGLGVS